MMMKKLIITAVAVFGLAFAANAQMYVGGIFGVGTSSGKTIETLSGDETTLKKPSSFALGISPRIGYMVNSKLSFGADLSYLVVSSTSFDAEDEISDWSTLNGFGISPFLRYSMFRAGIFSFNAEFQAGFGMGITNYKGMDDDAKGNIMAWGASIVPVVSLDVSRHITLETYINLFSLRYIGTNTLAQISEDDKTNNITHNFGFGFDSNNIARLGSIKIGFIYKF